METGSGPLLELHIKAAHDNPMPELKCRKCEFRDGRGSSHEVKIAKKVQDKLNTVTPCEKLKTKLYGRLYQLLTITH